jgi:hypothetical protein
MRHTPRQTALLLVTVLSRSGQTRARISAKTIKFLGWRNNLRHAFFNALAIEMLDMDWALFEISSGYAAVKLDALQAAKPVTALRWLTPEERQSLRNETFNFDALEREFADPEAPDDEEN